VAGPSLALGTVQFGLAYGVAGRQEPVPEAESRQILRRAWHLGIDRLDTAPAYGDVEKRLGTLIGDLPFSIVSKIPSLPPTLPARDARSFVASSIGRSRELLGPRLKGMLFHNSGDLTGPHGSSLWEEAQAAADGLALGASCYDAEELGLIQEQFALEMAQLPGSALDQGLRHSPPAAGIEVSLRSVFLQGLLLMPLDAASARVPAARPALEKWHLFCAEQGLPPLRAALSAAKGLPNLAYCVVGVDNLEQLEQIAEEWDLAPSLSAPELDTRSREVIDPRRWGPANV
jgi:hypothetical protein